MVEWDQTPPVFAGTPLEFNNLALDEALRSATQDGAQFATILRDAGKRPYRAGFLMRRFERRSVQARSSFFYRFCNNDGAVEHISRQRCFDCFRFQWRATSGPACMRSQRIFFDAG